MMQRAAQLTAFLAGTEILAAVPAGTLTVETEALSVELSADAGWTIRSVISGGDRQIIPVGGQGAVLARPDGKWVGSAMSQEEKGTVSSFSVTADGKEAELAPQGENKVTAQRVTIRKTSRLAGLDHTAKTVIQGHTIRQTHRFTARNAMAPKTFYAFIYSLKPSAQEWLAQDLNGKRIEGTFKQDGSHRPAAGSCRWLAQYDPTTSKGILVFLPDPAPEGTARFWDTESYHKLLVQPLRGPIAAGTQMEYSLILRFFEADTDPWQETVARLAGEYAAEFPLKEQQKPGAERLYGEGVPEQGTLTCGTGDYTVTFAADRAWTLFDMRWRNVRFGLGNGFYGTVMTPKGGKWWGTGHTEGGREIVHSLQLRVNGTLRPVRADETITGDEITIVKESTIWKFRVTARVSLSADGVFERTRLQALEDCDLSGLYLFMLCFPPASSRWLAELPDGELREGELVHDNGFEINTDTRWVAQFLPDPGLSLLCYTPRVIAGRKSMSKIWDKARYHKYYLQRCLTESFPAGAELDYSVIVKVVPEEGDDWAATKAAAKALAETYPPLPLEGETPAGR